MKEAIGYSFPVTAPAVGGTSIFSWDASTVFLGLKYPWLGHSNWMEASHLAGNVGSVHESALLMGWVFATSSWLRSQ